MTSLLGMGKSLTFFYSVAAVSEPGPVCGPQCLLTIIMIDGQAVCGPLALGMHPCRGGGVNYASREQGRQSNLYKPQVGTQTFI